MSYVKTVHRSPITLQIIYPLFDGYQRLANARNQNTKKDILAKSALLANSALKDFDDLSIVEGLLEIATGRRDTRILPTNSLMPAGYVPGPGIDADLMRALHIFKNNLKTLQRRLQLSSSKPLPSSGNSAANYKLQIIHPRPGNGNHNLIRNVRVLEYVGFNIEDLHILEDILEVATRRISWILPTTARIPAGYKAGPLIEAKYLSKWIGKMKELQVLLKKKQQEQTLFDLQRSISSKPLPSRTKFAPSNSTIPSRRTNKGNRKPNSRQNYVRLSVANYQNLRRLTRA